MRRSASRFSHSPDLSGPGDAVVEFDKRRQPVIISNGQDRKFVLRHFRAVSSEVERFLDTEEVRSSILLSPTK